MNSAPKLTDKSYGLRRKILLLQLNRRFAEDEMDTELLRRLQDEIEGIFFWSILGLSTLLNKGRFLESDRIVKDREVFFRSLNPVLLFTYEWCDLGESFSVRTSELYNEYRQWCEKTGNRPLKRSNFLEGIENIPGVNRFKDREDGGKWKFRGIKRNSEVD